MTTSGNVAADPMTPPTQSSAKKRRRGRKVAKSDAQIAEGVGRRSKGRADKGYASGSACNFR